MSVGIDDKPQLLPSPVCVLVVFESLDIYACILIFGLICRSLFYMVTIIN